MIVRAVIVTASPLTVRLNGSATAVPATKPTGITYTPVAGAAVLVAFISDTGAAVLLGPHA